MDEEIEKEKVKMDKFEERIAKMDKELDTFKKNFGMSAQEFSRRLAELEQKADRTYLGDEYLQEFPESVREQIQHYVENHDWFIVDDIGDGLKVYSVGDFKEELRRKKNHRLFEIHMIEEFHDPSISGCVAIKEEDKIIFAPVCNWPRKRQ